MTKIFHTTIFPEFMRKWVPQVSIFVALLVLAASVLSLVEAGKDKELWGDELMATAAAMGQTVIMPFTPDNVTTESLQMIYRPKVDLNDGESFYPQIFFDKVKFSNVVLATAQIDRGNALAYNLALHTWYRAFGVSDDSARLFSVFLGAILMLAVGFVAWKLTGSVFFFPIGVFAASQTPQILVAALETRSYSLAVLGLLLSLIFFLRIRDSQGSPRWNSICFFCALILTVMSHFGSAVVVLCYVPWLLYLLAKADTRKPAIRLVVTCALATVPVFLWMLAFGFDGQKITAVHYQLWYERALEANSWALIDVPEKVLGPAIAFFGSGANLVDVQILGETIRNGGTFSQLSSDQQFGASTGLVSFFLIFIASLFLKPRRVGEQMFLFFAVFSGTLIGAYLSIVHKQTIPLTYRYAVFSGVMTLPFVFSAIRGLFELWRNRASSVPSKWFGGSLTVLGLVFWSLQYVESSRAVVGMALSQTNVNKTSRAANKIMSSYKEGYEIVYSDLYAAMYVNLFLDPSRKIRQVEDRGQVESVVIRSVASGKTVVLEEKL